MRKDFYRVALFVSVLLGLFWFGSRPALAQWGSFGEVKIGESRTLKLEIGCYATQPCWRVTQYAIVGRDQGEFAIVGTDCGSFTGAPGSTCSFQTTFTPRAPAGPKEAYLALYGPNGESSQFQITGQAIASDPPPPVAIEITPPNPTTASRIFVRIFGEWSDSCVPQNPVVSISGTVIRIATSNPRGGCLDVLTPFEVRTSVESRQAGTYTVIVSYNGQRVAQKTFTVSDAPPVSLLARPTVVITGGYATVTWSGVATPKPLDWIGIFRSGSSDDASIWYYRTGGTASGTLQFRIPDGLSRDLYEFRLFSDATLNRLATSNSIRVEPAGPL